MSAPELAWQVVRDIGVHRCRFGHVGGAIDNFTEAAPRVGEDDESLLVLKAKAQLKYSEPTAALATIRKARKYPGNLLHCQALYETGDLEGHLLTSANGRRRQHPASGHRQQDFTAEVDLGLSTFDCTLGERAGASLLEYSHRFEEIAAEQRELRQRSVERPRWKVLAEAGECDVISVLETVRKVPPLREQIRRKKNKQILGQIHLGRGWEDWMFIEDLLPTGRYGPVVRLPQTRQSSQAMDQLVNECYTKVSARVRISQACYPVYSLRHGRFGPQSNHRREMYEIDELCKFRYRAYRAVHNQFDRMYELRDRGRTNELLRYGGEILNDFYKTTTVRVLPDKGKLVRELCNLIGLAILDGLRIPPSLMDEPPDRRLLLLFAVPPAKEAKVVVPVFGDISTYRDPTEPDHDYLRYKSKIAELERRYQRVQYPIEHCLVDYQMAREHLLNGWLDDVKVMGNRMIDEAIGCGSHLWQLIGLLTVAKALCAQHNLEQLAVQLRAAARLVQSRLPDERIAFFIEVSQKLNQDLLMKKLGQSLVLEHSLLV
ncbi:uncharacterized protein LOC126557682 [Anopheles maculipalpis]|uniref:uncharacterized protein LOC126557682 n=1 Tax=Anopheles maculipalpis TaxID=1496333 RepID=UPI00215941D9|nr:uncharacterized protein LOC126557682 [Anopheles maculipalpis]